MELPEPFNPDALRLGGMDVQALVNRPKTKPPRHRPGGAFLKGPIPWPWLLWAGRLPGKALHVALILWQEAGCRKSRKVRFRLTQAKDLGMHPDTARRGLRALEAAKLVTIHRQPGQCLEVTILDSPPA